MNNKILLLIKTINDNCSHVQELETLCNILRQGKYYEETTEKEYIVAITTMNSHYDYKCYTSPEFQNPDNHIDKVVENGDQIKDFKGMYYNTL